MVNHEKQEPEGRKTRGKIQLGKSIKHREKSQVKVTDTAQKSDVDRSAQLSLLVARVQEAMLVGDSTKVQELLGRLEALKGENNAYVMRLKAFWYLKEGNYASARALLQLLLSKNKNDLEAGINMAILDIKTKHMETARKRLRKMRRLHEENTMIPRLLEKIS